MGIVTAADDIDIVLVNHALEVRDDVLVVRLDAVHAARQRDEALCQTQLRHVAVTPNVDIVVLKREHDTDGRQIAAARQVDTKISFPSLHICQRPRLAARFPGRHIEQRTARVGHPLVERLRLEVHELFALLLPGIDGLVGHDGQLLVVECDLVRQE